MTLFVGCCLFEAFIISFKKKRSSADFVVARKKEAEGQVRREVLFSLLVGWLVGWVVGESSTRMNELSTRIV